VNCEICRVAGEPEFIEALDTGDFDLILADYHLPAFDGLTALALARQSFPEFPFFSSRVSWARKLRWNRSSKVPLTMSSNTT
jgi:CheY-like chemotaxis protein